MGKEKVMEFTNEMVADLFLGQEVINRKKRELREFLPMIRGLLVELGGPWPSIIMAPLSRSDNWSFFLASDNRSLRIMGECPKGHWHSDDELEFLGGVILKAGRCGCGLHHISLVEALALHAALSQALNVLAERAPGLEEKLQVFLEQAKEA